jgi:hypothetical protein
VPPTAPADDLVPRPPLQLPVREPVEEDRGAHVHGHRSQLVDDLHRGRGIQCRPLGVTHRDTFGGERYRELVQVGPTVDAGAAPGEHHQTGHRVGRQLAPQLRRELGRRAHRRAAGAQQIGQPVAGGLVGDDQRRRGAQPDVLTVQRLGRTPHDGREHLGRSGVRADQLAVLHAVLQRDHHGVAAAQGV